MTSSSIPFVLAFPPVVDDVQRHEPKTRACDRCTASLLIQPHYPWCPTLKEPWRVTRLALTPADQLLEDRLEEANRRACEAWLRGGGP